MSGDLHDVGRFAADFQDFLIAMQAAADRPSSLAERIQEHVGTDPYQLPATVAQFAPTDHPNLQLALEAVARDAELLGYVARGGSMMGVTLSDLLAGQEALLGSARVGDLRGERRAFAPGVLERRGERRGVPVELLDLPLERPPPGCQPVDPGPRG